MTRVLVFGTFDLLHDGHRAFFRQAREHGDTLSVVVSRDLNAAYLKGRAPLQNERERFANVAADPNVTEARLGYERRENVYRVLDDVKPDVICLGYDQNGFAGRLPDELAKRGWTIPVVRLNAHRPEKYKSSHLRPK